MSFALCLFLLIGALPLRAAAADGSTGIQIGSRTENTTYSCEGGGTAAWSKNDKTLTFTGSCTIAVSGTGKRAVLISGGDSFDTANVVVEEDAKVTLKTSGADGGYPLYGRSGLNITVKDGGSLTVENSATQSSEYGAIQSMEPLTIVVDEGGSLIARSMAGNQGEEAMGNALDGEGVSITNNGSLTAVGSGYGIYTGGTVTIGGTGVTLVAGGDTGIHSFSDTVIIENSTRGLVAGGKAAVGFAGSVENPVFTNNAADTFGAIDGAPADLWGLLERDPDFTNLFTGLDLSNVTESTCYFNKTNGLALWDYGDGSRSSSPHKLTLVGAGISPGGVKLPAGDVEVDLQGSNAITGGVSMTEAASGSNKLTLSGSGGVTVTNGTGVPFTGVGSVGIAPPEKKFYATAVAGDGGVKEPRGIPGSVFRAGSRGEYAPQTADRYFQLAYHPEDGLGANQYLLTVEEGFGGGVHIQGDTPALEFARGAGEPFFGWEQFDPETGESRGTDGIANPSSRTTDFTMPAEHTAIRAVVEDPNPQPPPGPGPSPSLETGEHRNYLNGYPDGTIRPEKNLTRAETAQLFYNLMDEASRERYESAENPFSDVKQDWSYTAICTLANAGILKGDPDGRFRPSGTVTRAEFAAIAARFEPGTYTGDDLFPDIAGHWARENINYAANKGWVQGYKDGTFRPNANITRAEAATLINKMLERAPETVDDLLPGRRVFTDNRNEKAWYYLALEEAANSHDYERKNYSGPEETWTALK